MEMNGYAMQPVTLRRAAVVDADKVRYRVYSTPTEFVAVIAESALMAVKISGIKNPHKVMRDLPSDGVAIDAGKITTPPAGTPPVAFPVMPGSAPAKNFQVEVPVSEGKTDQKSEFVPMGIADLRDKGGMRARILPPEMLYQIIEEHAKNAAAEPVPDPEPVAAPVAAEASAVPEELMLPSQPELTQAEKVVKMAEEILPATAPAEPAASPAEEKPALDADEVKKLLNE